MADSRIQDLPAASSVQAGDLFVIASAANSYNAMQVSGKVVTAYVEATAGAYATQSQASATAAQQAQQSAEASQTAAAQSATAAQSSAQTATTAQQGAEAAQTAAEQAAEQVQSIVAGNESYTKQEANDRFALALKTIDGPADTLIVYPDAGSNMTLISQGFTQQAGSGDPSPTNIRPITVGGVTLQKMVLDGSENWGAHPIQPSGKIRLSLSIPGLYLPGSDDVTATRSTRYPTVSSTDTYKGVFGIAQDWQAPLLYIYDPNFSTMDERQNWKSYLSQNPLTVWLQMADGSGDLYSPQSAQGSEYYCQCLPLNAPLCNGDRVSSAGAESHTSKFITVSQFEQGDGGYIISAPDAADGSVICNVFSGLSAASGQILVPASQFPSSVTSLETANQWLATQPVQIVYTLATPATYTTSPTPFIANPDDDGSVVVSGQTGGEMSATYNKSLARAFKELQTAVQALQALQTPSQPASEPTQPETEPSGEVTT